MRILILGATGFLGSTLFGLAESLNHTVLGTSRHMNEKANITQLDITDEDAVEQIIQEFLPDVVVWSLLSMNEEDVLIKFGLSNLILAISSQTKLIFISTDGVFAGGTGGYKESDNPIPIAEEAPLATYINSKILGEKKGQNNHPKYMIIRTGPLYGKDLNQNIEERTQKVIKEVEEKGFFHAATNMYRTFVNIEDLSKVILELSNIDFNGILHVGPLQKESYFTFYKRRLRRLGYDEAVIKPSTINSNENPYILLDTSLNTLKINNLLKSPFSILI
ncbi:sugar nucleotide-binding protein [Paraliobacillus zengyii]|uniref:sugar nucleotide-binding protein n=1 Tax=Paraliobacillus zengyii TaxID=2213194 RepID=UPI001300468C|nr:sugar nucleotide-binding protein [Paraliobacillus zengyii]